MGLSTVLAIVRSHHGFTNVCSEPGRGTTFSAYFPALEALGSHDNELGEDSTFLPGHGETVLVVDDEPEILFVTCHTLETFGYRVLTAGNGADAVALYAEHEAEIAVVLTDMMMPEMDGLTMIRALLKINPAVVVIAASGLDCLGGTVEASVRQVLQKPYTAGTLLKALRLIVANPEPFCPLSTA